MLKIRKFLSVLVAFVVFGVSFRGLSVNVEAATQHQPCSVTIDSPGNYVISGGSDTYTADAGDDVIFEFTITNNTTETYYVGGNWAINPNGGTMNVNGQITYIAGTTTSTSSMRLSNNDNPIDLEYTVTWTAAPTPPSGGGDSSSDTSSKTSTPVSHTHSYAWEDGKEATEDDNGEMIYRCSCGEVLYRVPTSAFNVFNRNTAEKIKNAKQGATVKIETSRWISFHKMVMQALADRPDVSLEVSFLDGEYKGNRVSFTIPAGTDTLSLLDENGFSGFLYLAGKFGTAN